MTLLSVGLLPPSWSPSGACRGLGTRLLNLFTPARVPPPRGCLSAQGLWHLTLQLCGTREAGTIPPPARGGHRDRLGHGPHTRAQRPGQRAHDLMRGLPPGAARPRALTQAARGLPPHGLDRRGELGEAEGQGPPALGRRASGPGPVPQRPTGRGLPGLRDASRAAARATGLFRRRQAQRMPEVSGGIDAGQGAECRDGRDSPRTRHATEGLQRVNDWAEPPGGARLVECLFQPLEPCGGVGDRPDSCLEAEVLGGGEPDDRAQPAQGRRAPGGPPCPPEIMPPQQGWEADRGRCENVERLVPRAA